MTSYLPLLTGDEIDWSSYGMWGTWSLLLWIGVPVVFLVLFVVNNIRQDMLEALADFLRIDLISAYLLRIEQPDCVECIAMFFGMLLHKLLQRINTEV